MNEQILNTMLWKHKGMPSFGMEAYKLGCRHERAAAAQRQAIEFTNVVEPSELERAEWTETTRAYVEALESVILKPNQRIA